MTQLSKFMIELDVDGEKTDVAVRPHHLLLDALRDGCGRTSVKEGCESASCGACTVLIDGKATLSCITLASDAVGRKVHTVESLSAADGLLHPLQQSFVDHHAIQCGFCTPGMLLTLAELLRSNPKPSEHEIREAISGNLCRCTGYVSIVKAVEALTQKSPSDIQR